MEELNENPIWTPEFHKQSVVGMFPIRDVFGPLRSNYPLHFNSFTRPEEPEYIYILEFSRKYFIFWYSPLTEKVLLLSLLNFKRLTF